MMKNISLSARVPLMFLAAVYLAAWTSGCAVGSHATEESKTQPETSLVKAEPVAKSEPQSPDLTPILKGQEKEIENNKAVLERQRQEITRLKVRLSEY